MLSVGCKNNKQLSDRMELDPATEVELFKLKKREFESRKQLLGLKARGLDTQNSKNKDAVARSAIEVENKRPV